MVAPFRHINREELYKLIWRKTMREVGEDLGIEASKVGRFCRRLKVPTPPLGYWEKLRCGKPVPQAPPLPIIQRGELRSVQVHRTDGKGWTPEELHERQAMFAERDRQRKAATEDALRAEARCGVLLDLSRRWEEAERLRRFVDRVEALLTDAGEQASPACLHWIRAEIEHLDPFTGGVEGVIATFEEATKETDRLII